MLGCQLDDLNEVEVIFKANPGHLRIILQGAKHMVKKCRASWEGLLRHLIVLSIHQCHLTLNPAVMAVDSILLIHTSQLIIGPFIL